MAVLTSSLTSQTISKSPQKTPRRDVNGILLFDKPHGLSSNQALQKVKYLFQAKKAGHTGSLDPLATGLLPICFGKATKRCQEFLGSDKEYIADLRLGARTRTFDSEGEVIATAPVLALDPVFLQSVLQRFLGPLQQIPPMYSALKFQGQRMYELARQGIEIPREPRAIEIFSLELLSIEPELLQLKIRCSKGTYIRTLADDIGIALGCYAHICDLRRTAINGLPEIPMVTWQQLQELKEQQGLAALDALLFN